MYRLRERDPVDEYQELEDRGSRERHRVCGCCNVVEQKVVLRSAVPNLSRAPTSMAMADALTRSIGGMSRGKEIERNFTFS